MDSGTNMKLKHLYELYFGLVYIYLLGIYRHYSKLSCFRDQHVSGLLLRSIFYIRIILLVGMEKTENDLKTCLKPIDYALKAY